MHMQVLDQQVQLRAIEARVFGLEDEIVLLGGMEQLGDRLAATAIVENMIELLPKIRAPFAEVVIDIDRGTPASVARAFSRARFRAAGNAFRNRASPLSKSMSLMTSISISAIGDSSGTLPCRSSFLAGMPSYRGRRVPWGGWRLAARGWRRRPRQNAVNVSRQSRDGGE